MWPAYRYIDKIPTTSDSVTGPSLGVLLSTSAVLNPVSSTSTIQNEIFKVWRNIRWLSQYNLAMICSNLLPNEGVRFRKKKSLERPLHYIESENARVLAVVSTYWRLNCLSIYCTIQQHEWKQIGDKIWKPWQKYAIHSYSGSYKTDFGSHYSLLTYLLTYSMVQSPSWEDNWFAASQEIPRISQNRKVHYRTQKRPPPVSILGQPNPVHIPTSHLLEFHPNIIHPSTPRSPQWSLSLRFPHQDPIHPPLLHDSHLRAKYASIGAKDVSFSSVHINESLDT